MQARQSGWGTWIRTKTGGVRVRCPTVRRSPTSADVELELRPCKPQAARTFAVLAVAKRAWQGSPGEAGDLPIPSNLASSLPYSGKMPEFDLRKSVGPTYLECRHADAFAINRPHRCSAKGAQADPWARCSERGQDLARRQVPACGHRPADRGGGAARGSATGSSSLRRPCKSSRPKGKERAPPTAASNIRRAISFSPGLPP